MEARINSKKRQANDGSRPSAMKIRLRLTLWFTGLVTLIVSAGAIAGWLGVRSYSENLVRTELREKQVEIQGFVDSLVVEFERQHLAFDLRRNADALQSIFVNDQTSLYSTLFIQLTDARGQVISRSTNLGGQQLPVHAVSPARPLRSTMLTLDRAQIEVIYTSAPLLVKGRPQGQLQLGISMDRTRHMLEQLAAYEAVLLVLSLLASLVLGQFLAQRAMEPMLEVTSQVRQMAGRDLFRRLDTSHLSQDEIGVLADTFNGLLQRIEEVFLAQQRFLTDASHEFRTPLTAIRGHAQLLEKRGSNEDVRLKSSATIIRESRRLSRLVDDLLLLARLESQTGQFTSVDLGMLVREIYEDLEPLHSCLQLECPDRPMRVSGHADSLRRVLLNLLNNAFEALTGNEQAHVLLSCNKTETMARIQIQDNGPGIPPEHLPHLFERFYRVNRDRSRETGGSGIGLALVYEIVRLHNGSVEVSSRAGEGTTFTLLLPLEKPKPQA